MNMAACPECGSTLTEEDERFPECYDCGFVQYDLWTLRIQAEVREEQAHAKRVLGYIPTYREAVEKGFTK